MTKKELMRLIVELEYKAGKARGLAEENAEIGGMNALLGNFWGGKAKAYLEVATMLRHLDADDDPL